MEDRYTDGVKNAWKFAGEEASKLGSDYLGTEHLLLGIAHEKDSAGGKILNSLGVTVEAVEPLLAGQGRSGFFSRRELYVAPRTKRVLEMALEEANDLGNSFVGTEHLLLAILREGSGVAMQILEHFGVTQEKLQKAFDTYISEDGNGEGSAELGEMGDFAIDLNEKAKQGKIDPVIGRQTEINRVIQILSRRNKNNPVLIGEPGVGKTAIAEGLAQRIVSHDVPEILKDCHVISLNMSSVVAGTKYRGEFEERLKKVIDEVKKHKDWILFVDELHTLVGAGSSEGSMDAANIMKPALARGELRCIGATTYDEYRTIFDKDHALSRRFQKIDIAEPSVAETVQILRGLKPVFESFHEVRYTQAALEAAAELSARYINERFLPDKAIDVMDEAGAAQRILPKSKQKKVIGKAQIEAVIAKVARIPEKTVSHDDKQVLQYLGRDLKNMVFGQDGAIEALVAAVKMARSGLGLPDKPIGSFLFSGPTGVGKTEVARQLAFSLGVPLQRFDMSEYMERHAVSRLIGSPPGYVGFEQGGLLTEAVNKQPYCVLLLDEIEKAHPDIFNVLLQVMDHGKLTDNNGKSADFRNVIIIMTTNAGAESLSRPTVGFTNKRERGDEMQAINKLFTPEFRNRLDAMIPFAPLTAPIIAKVVDKFLLQLEQQLLEKKVEAEFTPALRAWLAEKGFDPQMGARPMHRLIQDQIRKALADELLFGRLTDGGYVRIDWDVKNAEVVLQFKKPAAKKMAEAAAV